MAFAPAVILAAQIAGSVAVAAGTGYSIVQGQKAAAASKRAEVLREKQLRLESGRKRRESIRQFQANRATSLSNITGATGSALGGGSAIGGLGGLTSNLSTQLNTIDQATDIGSGIFRANADYAQYSANAQTGAGAADFGKSLFNNAPEIGRVGTTLFG
jgi:hypothetical protein